MKATITLKLDVRIEDDELASASIRTEQIENIGANPGEALAARDTVMKVLDEREVIVDVCDEGSVLLTHRLIQHPQP